MIVTTQKIKGPAAIQQQLMDARAQFKAKLSRAASSSERKWLADQITVANIALRELRKKRVPPKVYRELDELTDRERVMKIGRGRDVIYHGTRNLPAVLRAGKFMPSDFSEPAVFFTRSPEIAAYFACLMGEKKERRSPGVLILDRSSLRQCYRLEPNRYDHFHDRNEREEAVWGRTVSFRRHLVGVVSEADVSKRLGPPRRRYLPRGFASWPATQRRIFNECHLASGRKLVADGRAAVRNLIVRERLCGRAADRQAEG
jgi:hypothetical protein